MTAFPLFLLAQVDGDPGADGFGQAAKDKFSTITKQMKSRFKAKKPGGEVPRPPSKDFLQDGAGGARHSGDGATADKLNRDTSFSDGYEGVRAYRVLGGEMCVLNCVK